MNVTPNIPDWQHAENRKLAESLRAEGYRIEVSSQGYQVWGPSGAYIAGAGTLKAPHGRYREANTRDNLAAALTHCARSAAA